MLCTNPAGGAYACVEMRFNLKGVNLEGYIFKLMFIIEYG